MLSQISRPIFLVPLLISIAILAVNLNTKNDFADPQRVKALFKEGALLIDVRTVQEYDRGHIEGAINIPITDLNQKLKELRESKAIIVYCRSGNRSTQAKKLLNQQGLKQVYNLGGMGRWSK